MNRSDPLWDLHGPEYEPETQEERLERLKREEMKTRLLRNNNDMLIDVIKGWLQ
jgi:hypothetical protein